jgi:hypothetical protein
MEGVEVLVVVDTPQQGDFGGTHFLQGHIRWGYSKDREGVKTTLVRG